jgi:hypothetical protein
VRREIFNPIDEPDAGTDSTRAARNPDVADYAVTLEQVVEVITQVSRPRRATTRPTPFQP